jgi:hypothetical protein
MPKHVYDVRPRKDKRGVTLFSDALPFGRLWYGESDAISNANGRDKNAGVVARKRVRAGRTIFINNLTVLCLRLRL